MDKEGLKKIFTKNFIDELLPLNLSDQFFEALYGDASEGAYDINLKFISADNRRINLAFHLVQRPEKCLACSLTYGLPNVFSRHPLININNMVKKIEDKGVNIKAWHLGNTQEKSSSLHSISLCLDLE